MPLCLCDLQLYVAKCPASSSSWPLRSSLLFSAVMSAGLGLLLQPPLVTSAKASAEGLSESRCSGPCSPFLLKRSVLYLDFFFCPPHTSMCLTSFPSLKAASSRVYTLGLCSLFHSSLQRNPVFHRALNCPALQSLPSMFLLFGTPASVLT